LDLREECLGHGADGFLLKPFMPDDLLSMLMDDAA
jgi:CheY-like chemotaxis protein